MSSMTLADLAIRAARNARRKGFHDPLPPPSPDGSDPLYDMTPEERCEAFVDQVDRCLNLIHTEVSEATEAWRRASDPAELLRIRVDGSAKPTGFPIEMADIILRTLGLCELLGIEIEQAVGEKMGYNETRPEFHGGLRA